MKRPRVASCFVAAGIGLFAALFTWISAEDVYVESRPTGRGVIRISVENRTQSSMVLTSISLSCECLTLTERMSAPQSIPAGGRWEFDVRIARPVPSGTVPVVRFALDADGARELEFPLMNLGG
jgi:hypothetical protein